MRDTLDGPGDGAKQARKPRQPHPDEIWLDLLTRARRPSPKDPEKQVRAAASGVVRVADALRKHAGWEGSANPGGNAHPGVNRLVELTGLSDRQVRRNLAWLRENRWAERIRRAPRRGVYGSEADVYRLCTPEGVPSPFPENQPVVDDRMVVQETNRSSTTEPCGHPRPNHAVVHDLPTPACEPPHVNTPSGSVPEVSAERARAADDQSADDQSKFTKFGVRVDSHERCRHGKTLHAEGDCGTCFDERDAERERRARQRAQPAELTPSPQAKRSGAICGLRPPS